MQCICMSTKAVINFVIYVICSQCSLINMSFGITQVDRTVISAAGDMK